MSRTVGSVKLPILRARVRTARAKPEEKLGGWMPGLRETHEEVDGEELMVFWSSDLFR